jgi:hypothetical protein
LGTTEAPPRSLCVHSSGPGSCRRPAGLVRVAVAVRLRVAASAWSAPPSARARAAACSEEDRAGALGGVRHSYRWVWKLPSGRCRLRMSSARWRRVRKLRGCRCVPPEGWEYQQDCKADCRLDVANLPTAWLNGWVGSSAGLSAASVRPAPPSFATTYVSLEPPGVWGALLRPSSHVASVLGSEQGARICAGAKSHSAARLSSMADAPGSSCEGALTSGRAERAVLASVASAAARAPEGQSSSPYEPSAHRAPACRRRLYPRAEQPHAVRQ